MNSFGLEPLGSRRVIIRNSPSSCINGIREEVLERGNKRERGGGEGEREKAKDEH